MQLLQALVGGLGSGAICGTYDPEAAALAWDRAVGFVQMPGAMIPRDMQAGIR
jgi:hypothetical protein